MVAALLAVAAPAVAEVVVSPEDMAKLAAVALSQQDPISALRFAEALIERDAGDATAWMLKSRAERDLGRNASAAKSARASWRTAEGNREKYAAALAMAQALSSSGRRTAAQLWLRRAVEVAPNDTARMVATRDYDYVRSRNPLALRFDLSVRPSSNVNNGASDPVFEFMGYPFQLSGDALALSGVEATTALSGRYRLSETDSGVTDLRFAGTQKLVWLSDEAQAQAPEARNGDYSFAAVELGLTRRAKLGATKLVYTAGIAAGHTWFGGENLTDYLRADLGIEGPLSASLTGFATLGAESQHSLQTGQGSAEVLGASGGLVAKRANGDQIKLALEVGQTRSTLAPASYESATLALGYTRAAPVLGVALAANLGVEARDYGFSPYTSDGRQDLRLSAGVQATLTKIDYMGFSPVLSVSVQEARSTVSIYQTQTVGFGLSVQSNF
jgi:hypothetical protein